MKVDLKRGSLVLKVAGYGGLYVEDRTDLCSVFWHFVWGVLRAPVLTITFGLIGAGIGFMLVMLPIIGLIAFFVEGVAIQEFAWVGLAVWSGLGLLFAVAGFKEAEVAAPVRRLARAGYRSWKDKTCVLIDVT